MYFAAQNCADRVFIHAVALGLSVLSLGLMGRRKVVEAVSGLDFRVAEIVVQGLLL